jgi:hypothetical protein
LRATPCFASILLLLAGCQQRASELEADEFCALLEPPLQTMHNAEPLGIRDGRAYLAKHTMSTLDKGRWKRELYWSDLTTLPEPCRIKFAAATRSE